MLILLLMMLIQNLVGGEEWNWLDGHSNAEIEAKNVHFTTGGPWFTAWKPLTTNENEYVDEWKALRDKIIIDEGLVNV